MSDTIIVGYDGTAGARAALDEAVGLANRLGARVVAVFSFVAPRIGGEVADLDEVIDERAQKVLDEAMARIKQAGADGEVRHLAEHPAEGLSDLAEQMNAAMVVVGSYGEGPLRSIIVGSTPTKLLHLCSRPVLVVRAERDGD